MSLLRVAQLAGVSTSTVSRVVHDHPSVASDTANAVRAIMQQLQFTPAIRVRRSHANGAANAQATSLGFVILGASGANAAPAFEKLLRGVSDGCNENGLSLTIAFVGGGDGPMPQWLLGGAVDGVLLHGEQPSPAVQARLQALPAVWLMANRHRPCWGDQVMPNNAVIGDLAARYLVRRGHRRLAHLGVSGDAWSLRLRAFAFVQAARDAGAEAHVYDSTTIDGGNGNGNGSTNGQEPAGDYWCADGLAAAADALVAQLRHNGSPRPTGLFVAEDRLLPLVDRALRDRGIRSGPDGDVEIVSCNNERPHHAGLQSQPAVIDIHPEAIGRRGVEQLVWRMRNRDVRERVRTMVDPTLIEPPANERTPSEAAAADAAGARAD